MSPDSSQEKQWIALALSGLVLPGLGQIHQGERKKGWFFVITVLSVTIITFAKYMMGILQVMERHHFPRPPKLNIIKVLSEAYQMEKTWVWVGVGLTVLLWVWSVLDLGWKRKI